jgi:hypothetical protein
LETAGFQFDNCPRRVPKGSTFFSHGKWHDFCRACLMLYLLII